MISLFIYYRVAERDRVDAESLIRSMQARLACRSGIAGRLMKKRDEPGLWMEIYEPIAHIHVFERMLAQLEDEYDIAMFIDGLRHREVFQNDHAPISAC